MSYQVVDKAFGYRVGYFGKFQRRVYVFISSGSIEFTEDVSKSTLFSEDELFDVLARLMSTVKRDYFICTDHVHLVSSVDLKL